MQDAQIGDATMRKSNANMSVSADTRHANYAAMTNGTVATK
jgi:hypothetical protein